MKIPAPTLYRMTVPRLFLRLAIMSFLKVKNSFVSTPCSGTMCVCVSVYYLIHELLGRGPVGATINMRLNININIIKVRYKYS